MKSTERHIYQFGPYSLNPSERRLERDGNEIYIRPKAFDTLTYFVENPRRLISRVELLDAVWKNTHVELSNLAVVISELRRILGKDVEIQAIRGHGYRLIVNVNITIVKDSLVEKTTTLQIPKKNEVSRSLRVFLCHSSTDKAAVRELYERLRTDGIDPWLDEENLLPGQAWEQEIPKAVRNNDIVIVCLSRTAVGKTGYVQKEIRYALDVADELPDGTIFLIPLRLEHCEIPDRLRRWHCVNLFEEKGYEKLMRALQFRAAELHPEDN